MSTFRLLLGAFLLTAHAASTPVPSNGDTPTSPRAGGLEPGQLPLESVGPSGTNWLGFLSSWGWGEGEVQILVRSAAEAASSPRLPTHSVRAPSLALLTQHDGHETTDLTFPSRSASFAPRLSSNPSSDSNLANPLYSTLLPITSFPSSRLPKSNVSYSPTIHGCPPIPHRATDSAPAPASPAIQPHRSYVALVLRGGACTFSAKVRYAQSVGAAAVLVGDEALPGEPDDVGRHRTGPLVTMFSPGQYLPCSPERPVTDA